MCSFCARSNGGENWRTIGDHFALTIYAIAIYYCATTFWQKQNVRNRDHPNIVSHRFILFSWMQQIHKLVADSHNASALLVVCQTKTEQDEYYICQKTTERNSTTAVNLIPSKWLFANRCVVSAKKLWITAIYTPFNRINSTRFCYTRATTTTTSLDARRIETDMRQRME